MPVRSYSAWLERIREETYVGKSDLFCCRFMEARFALTATPKNVAGHIFSNRPRVPGGFLSRAIGQHPIGFHSEHGLTLKGVSTARLQLLCEQSSPGVEWSGV